MKRIVFHVSVVVGIVGICFATVIPIPPTEETVRGVWIGFPPEANDFYRLLLQEHSGVFASSFAGEKTKLYIIESWSLDSKGQLMIKTSPISTNAYPVLINGKANSSNIQLKISGRGGSWTQEVVLHREELIEKRI